MVVLSSKYNIEQVYFTDQISFQHLTSLRKSALIQKPSAQIPEALNHHGIEIFSEKAFHGGGDFFEQIYKRKIKFVHWYVDGYLGSQFDQGTSLLKSFAWKHWGQEEIVYDALSQLLYLCHLEEQRGLKMREGKP